jgi:[acyl-carrier-protein] S-malonyltransferase
MDFADAVRTVRQRGRYMQDAVPVGVGAMAAVVGLPLDKLREVCKQAAQGEVVSPANINSPDQIVISGNTGAVTRAAELAKEAGAKRAIMLPVSAPFHCPLMAPAQKRLAADLQHVRFREPEIPVISNIDAEPTNTASYSRDALVRQVTGAVRWEQSMRKLMALGVENFVEVGPGRVLTGLMRQIDKEKTCLNIEDEASLQKFLNHFEPARAEAE